MSEERDSAKGAGLPDKKAGPLPKLVGGGILGVLALVILVQNSDSTSLKLLGFEVQWPLFIVIVLSMLLGWALGELGLWAWRRRRRRALTD